MKLNSITSTIYFNKGLNTPMTLNKTLAGLVGTAGLLAVSASAAMAQQVTFASAAGFGPNQSTVFNYSGGAGGTFTTTGTGDFFATSSPFFDSAATLTFTGFSASGAVTGSGTLADPYLQKLGNGTFKLTGTGGTDLLDGSFTGGNLLSATSSSASGSITETTNGVTYTGGSYFAASGLANPGSFTVGLTSVAPAPTVTNGYLNSFTAGGTATFSASKASAVPEPATTVPFVLGGLGLLVLAVRKTRRASAAV